MDKTERINPIIFAPTERLQQGIKYFWILEGAQQVYQKHEIIPDPYEELIFNFGAPIFLVTKDGNKLKLPAVYVGHLQTQPQRLITTGKSCVMAIRLYPWVVPSYLANDITLRYMDITTLNKDWLRFAEKELRKRIEYREYSEAVGLLQQFLLDRWGNGLPQVLPVQQVGQLLSKTNGQTRMDDLAAYCALSVRQLERRFKYFTGVTPKTYARLVRLEAFCQWMINNPADNLAELAGKFGYIDQSHLTHEFNQLAGCTPKTLAARAQQYYRECQNDGFLQDR
jgi:AraC-like DNA-binding protein